MLNFENISEIISHNINYYWKDFQLTAFALYDKEKVYLYNHPKFSTENKPYHLLNWNDQFNGADTLIIYEEYPTAIVNLDSYHDDMESVYAIVVHELFHGFQYLLEENRFPNELLGISYPLLNENVELRNKERKCLYDAVTSTSKIEKRIKLNNFISLREKRRMLIGEFMEYENSIETVEGPAFYVESHAYSHISSNKEDIIVKKYGKHLIDGSESTFHLRKSNYSSGLFICLLLDEISPDWKETFFDTDKCLYDLLKDTVELEIDKNIQVKISEETNSIINKIKKSKQDIFREFENREGYHLFITGEIGLAGFDPMNIVAYEKRFLHKRFISISINDKAYQINQPAITYYYGEYNSINKVHVVLNTEPVHKNGLVSIKGIGEIQGQYFKDKNYYYYINCSTFI
ncbi:peptide ABC transporter permease [Oceanobacillus jeddahense]|uniref:Peptide ABC transporter permease n=1 Tax=Oceanobacillus jeddahense TaxID=1462527 RepID=A0ABY5JYR1_9BACI|nr:peptide ABC transporter permease [Oceanobacillus jeddahense]UUI04939.1 peptide ABC transporter permease [Oceanobacillus jeddahense]